jgi:hypothetical protein
MAQKAGNESYSRQSTAEKYTIANRLLTDPNAVALPHVIEEAKRTIDFVKSSKSRPKHAQAGILYDTLQNLKSQEAAQKKAAATKQQAAAAPKPAAPAAPAPAAPAPVFTPPAPESSPAAASAGTIVGTQLTGTMGADTANTGKKRGGGRRGRVSTLLGGFGGGGETFGG